MLKRLLFGFLLFSALVTGVKAQGIEITPMTGYTFAAGFPISGGRAQLGDGQNWGGFLGIGLNDFTEVELSYSYMSTSATASSRNLQLDVNTTAQIHYAMIGGNRLFPVSEKATFFAGGKLGTGTIAFPNRDYRNQTRFSVGFQGGVRVYPSERIGLRVQANLMFPILSSGASLWWSPGGGTAVGITGWSPLVQFGFTGGLIFRLQR
jgi:hypothetical protein